MRTDTMFFQMCISGPSGSCIHASLLVGKSCIIKEAIFAQVFL